MFNLFAAVESLRPLQNMQADFAQLQGNLHRSILEGGAVAGLIAGLIVAAAVIVTSRNKDAP